MYFCYARSKRVLSIFILAIQLLLMRSVLSLNLTNEYLNHKCLVSQGKYAAGSEYEKNLNSLFDGISSLPYVRDGFRHSTVDGPPVTVIFQCRGDSYGSKCRSCAATVAAEFRKRCPRNKGGTIWYDQCFLDVNMINDRVPRKTNYENIFSMHNPNNVSRDIESFNNMTSGFLHELILKAARPREDGLGFLYYAAGQKNLGTNKLYAMVQCAQDVLDCKGCLEWSIRELSKCCNGKQGARVLGTICSVRYELYPFLRN